MKIRGKKFQVGRRVKIIQDCRGIPAMDATGKEATYEGNCFIRNGKRYRGCRMFPFDVNPKFKLDDGSIIWGYECYWMPLGDALEIEKKLAQVSDQEADIKQRLDRENQALLKLPRIEMSAKINAVRSFGKAAFITLDNRYQLVCKSAILGEEFVRKLFDNFHPGDMITTSGPEIETKSGKKTICAIAIDRVINV